MPFSSGKMFAAPNFARPRVLVTQQQWTILGLLLSAIALEAIFSPYWHKFYASIIDGAGAQRKIKVQPEAFFVLAFLLFGLLMIVMLGGVLPRAGFAVAGLIFLSVFLARAAPITDWIAATSTALKEASGT